MAYFEHEGCTLHYEEYGHGTPLILIHGLGSSSQDWELQIPVLARHYRLIVVDVRGHGRSDKPRERYSIEGFTYDLIALIEHLDLPPATLSAHLNVLRAAALVHDEREGRVIRVRANYLQMNGLIAYLTENCCNGVAACAPATQPAAQPAAHPVYSYAGEARFLLGQSMYKRGDAAGALIELERAFEARHDDNEVVPDFALDAPPVLTPVTDDAPGFALSANAPVAPPPADMLAFDLSDINLDLNDKTPAPPAMDAEPSGLGGLTAENPLETKLSLAEEFRAIGDLEGARSLAEEVLAEASGSLKTKASAFLADLS